MSPRRKGKLIVVSAPSGAGKTTLCGSLSRAEKNIIYAVSYTTRPPRPGEVDGKDYYFVSEEEFKAMTRGNEFAEWARVHNHYYGTHEGFIRRKMDEGVDVLLDVDVQGAKLLKKRFPPPEGVFIFVLPPSMDVWISRLNQRRLDSKEEIKRRLKVARDEIKKHSEFDYLIINNEIERAVHDLNQIIFSKWNRKTEKDSEWIFRQFLEGMEKTE